jgi:hypothetical protein
MTAAAVVHDPRIFDALERHRDFYFRRTASRRETGENSALKFIEDLYLAKVYTVTAERLHLDAWRSSVESKLKVVQEIFEISRFTVILTSFPSVRSALAALSSAALQAFGVPSDTERSGRGTRIEWSRRKWTTMKFCPGMWHEVQSAPSLGLPFTIFLCKWCASTSYVSARWQRVQRSFPSL